MYFSAMKDVINQRLLINNTTSKPLTTNVNIRIRITFN